MPPAMDDDAEKASSSLVEWDGSADPENPSNWPTWKKWMVTMLMSSMTMWVTFSTSVFSSATRVTAKEFGVSTEVMTLGSSLMLLGFALGPLIWGPMSELYGRRLPLFFGFTVFLTFQIAVAVAQNIDTIMLGRFFAGLFGCAPLAVVGGALADFWNPVDRGVAMSLFASATFVGPIFGPIVGGFVVNSPLGWRWTAWITLILASFFGFVGFLVIPESYPRVLLQQRAVRLRKKTGNWALHSWLDEHQPSGSELLRNYILRPVKMLFSEPILLLITLYLSLVYGILYLFFVAYPISFEQDRGWTHAGVAGLPFLAILVGVACGTAMIVYLTKTRYAHKLAETGKVVPEERLVPMMIASVLLPVGLFWFGWTSKPSIHWMAQVVAGVPIGMGILVIFMQGLNYLVDVYLMYANSGIAANTLVRSTVGAAFPLFAQQMYGKLGVNWASSVLGFISLAMIPIPFIFYMYGAKIRAMSRFSPD